MLGVAAVDGIEDNHVIYQSNEEGKMWLPRSFYTH